MIDVKKREEDAARRVVGWQAVSRSTVSDSDLNRPHKPDNGKPSDGRGGDFISVVKMTCNNLTLYTHIVTLAEYISTYSCQLRFTLRGDGFFMVAMLQ